MSHRLTLRELYRLHPEGIFIPYYQRHYVWGVDSGEHKDPAVYLTDCLLEAYRRGEKYFLQGVTFAGDYLVDGQQRLTYLYLLLRYLGVADLPPMRYDNRDAAQQWISAGSLDATDDTSNDTQDIALFKSTLRHLQSALTEAGINMKDFAEYVLDKVELLHITLDAETDEIVIFQMMNGTKAPMAAADIIKADIMRMASDPDQPHAYDWELMALRSRYAVEWASWVRWWNTAAVRQYFSPLGQQGLDLLLKLCLRTIDDDFSKPLRFEELGQYLAARSGDKSVAAPRFLTKDDVRSLKVAPHAERGALYNEAKHLFETLRSVQRRIDDAYSDPTAYNRIRAVILLQSKEDAIRFLFRYFVECSIDEAELLRYYKLSFLGMTTEAIHDHAPVTEAFDDLLASLSVADVYHSDTKRDVFNLLLRLNIDEDTKLGRKFDFSVWENRSLEHVYPKSKVWHTDGQGHVLDGNDNILPLTVAEVEADASYIPRNSIVNHDGTQLSEHSIGNLVMLYGQNNSEFGNATFAQKKMMFLAPGDMTVFRSRNLLHTVCVFAANSWNHRSIIDNYNSTLKNLKIYYGVK